MSEDVRKMPSLSERTAYLRRKAERLLAQIGEFEDDQRNGKLDDGDASLALISIDARDIVAQAVFMARQWSELLGNEKSQD